MIMNLLDYTVTHAIGGGIDTWYICHHNTVTGYVQYYYIDYNVIYVLN